MNLTIPYLRKTENRSHNGRKAKDLIERFWKHVRISLPNNCWEWTGRMFSNGYGNFRIGTNRKNYLAHRISFIIKHGMLSDKILVLHKCDNTKCVNPDHLFLGTHKDNTQDCIRKGRKVIGFLIGSQNPNSIFTNSDVKKIRRMRFIKFNTIRQISTLFGVSNSCISHIIKGRNWKHI